MCHIFSTANPGRHERGSHAEAAHGRAIKRSTGNSLPSLTQSCTSRARHTKMSTVQAWGPFKSGEASHIIYPTPDPTPARTFSTLPYQTCRPENSSEIPEQAMRTWTSSERESWTRSARQSVATPCGELPSATRASCQMGVRSSGVVAYPLPGLGGTV